MSSGRWIKNYDVLVKTKYHQDALDIVESAYDEIDTDNAIKKSIKLENNLLKINSHQFDLNKYGDIYLVGAGKVACQAAETIEKILIDRIKRGTVIGIKSASCNVVKTHVGSHPMPSEINFTASQDMIDIGRNVNENDLVIAIVGGGGSSLLCSSENECEQGQKLYKAFLNSGGDISELNIVRRHMSDLKGGGLAKYLYPATVVGLIFSDVPGDDYSTVASGPTYKDDSTIDDAKIIIDKYNLGEFDLIETPKEDKFFEKIINIPIVSNRHAVRAMAEKAKQLGYESNEFSCEIYDPQKETCLKLQNESKPNSVVIAGGETKLIVPEHCEGSGGRNNMLALEMLDYIKENQIFISFASDGYDNGESAGAIVDYGTKAELGNMKLNVEDYKVCLDSYTIFEKSGNLILTDKIEANVSDLMILLTFK